MRKLMLLTLSPVLLLAVVYGLVRWKVYYEA